MSRLKGGFSLSQQELDLTPHQQQQLQQQQQQQQNPQQPNLFSSQHIQQHNQKQKQQQQQQQHSSDALLRVRKASTQDSLVDIGSPSLSQNNSLLPKPKPTRSPEPPESSEQ
jgi:hypothetical protein